MIEIYSSLFNALKMGIDYKDAIHNFCGFGDRVTIAVNTSEDETYDAVCALKDRYNNLNVVSCNFDYNNIRFDGLIKNHAMQHCVMDYVSGLDADERVCAFQKPSWNDCCHYIDPMNSDAMAISLPSLDLVGSKYTYKSIGAKPSYLHRRRGIHRGVWKLAELPNGKVDIERSDTCEVLIDDNELAPAYWNNFTLELIKQRNTPVIFHDWGIDLKRRAKINKFWKPVWEARCGRKVTNVITKLSDLKKIPVFEHGLTLWDE